MLKLFGSPGRYLQGPGAIAEIGPFAARTGTRAIIVADRYVAQAYGGLVRDRCEAGGVPAALAAFDGEITRETVETLVAEARASRADLVVALGGGKSIDAGKAVCNALRTRLITVPTVASNDAPTSKNYVIYDDDHTLVAVEHLPFSPDYVVVDTEILARAPRDLLRAGIGDAVSKRFEAEQAFAAKGPNMFGYGSTLAAQMLAQGCFQILFADAEAALDCASTGVPSPAFERTVEATLLLSGLGFESGGLSIAHALTRGWPEVPAVAQAPHGYQIALGLLIQLTLENRQDDMLARLTGWFRQLGLPTGFADLGAAPSAERLERVAAKALTAPHARNFVRRVTTGDLARAMQEFG